MILLPSARAAKCVLLPFPILHVLTMPVFDRSRTHACLCKSALGVYRCQMALQSTAGEMIDVSAQWLTEIRRTLQCLGCHQQQVRNLCLIYIQPGTGLLEQQF